MKKIFLLFLGLMLTAGGALWGQHRVRFELRNYGFDTLMLGYHAGGQRYIRDTVVRGQDGSFVFEGRDTLPHGLYMAVMYPNGSALEFVMEDAREMTFSTSVDSLHGAMRVAGSPLNVCFFECKNMYEKAAAEMFQRQQTVGLLRKAGAAAEAVELERSIFRTLDSVAQAEVAHAGRYKGSLMAAIIRAGVPVVPPNFGGDRAQQIAYLKAHYFDAVDLGDVRLRSTPFPYERVIGYIRQLTPYHPDSLKTAIDDVLKTAAATPTSFEYWFRFLFNYFGTSEDAGMDGGYVHLVDRYVSKGKTPWTSTKDSLDFVQAADALRPILIGKIAPDFTFELKDSTESNLHSVKAPLTVLIFWDPDCNRCQHHMPGLIETYKRLEGSGVAFLGVCTRVGPTYRRCYEYADQVGAPWPTVADPMQKSRFLSMYNLSKYPQVFILDEHKKIVAKKVEPEKLEIALRQLLNFRRK